jgi:hypothetical protein
MRRVAVYALFYAAIIVAGCTSNVVPPAYAPALGLPNLTAFGTQPATGSKHRRYLHGTISAILGRRLSLDTHAHARVDVYTNAKTVMRGVPKVGKYAQVAAADESAVYVAVWDSPPPQIETSGRVVAATSFGFTLHESHRYPHVFVVVTSSTKQTENSSGEVRVKGDGSLASGIVASRVVEQTPSPSPSPTLSPSPTPPPTPTPSPVTSGPNVPVFSSSFRYGGTAYPYTIVGSNPKTAPTSTTINVAIVPVRLAFSDGTVLDGTSVAPYIPQSPLFTYASYPAGYTQFGDAVMRSEFWYDIGQGSANYHVLLASPTMEPTVSLSVPSSDGHTSVTSGSTEGYVTFSWLIQTEEKQIIDELHIPPTTMTIFATLNTEVLEPDGSYCCYRGYHYFFPVTTSSGTQTWTTAWASVTPTDIESLSHEVSEWLNDPFYNNRVPPWVQPGETACGGDDLEVGDPVTNHSSVVKGFVVQDIAFFSWFTRTSPSIGINHWYDLQNYLKAPAKNCS